MEGITLISILGIIGGCVALLVAVGTIVYKMAVAFTTVRMLDKMYLHNIPDLWKTIERLLEFLNKHIICDRDNTISKLTAEIKALMPKSEKDARD